MVTEHVEHVPKLVVLGMVLLVRVVAGRWQVVPQSIETLPVAPCCGRLPVPHGAGGGTHSGG